MLAVGAVMQLINKRVEFFARIPLLTLFSVDDCNLHIILSFKVHNDFANRLQRYKKRRRFARLFGKKLKVS